MSLAPEARDLLAQIVQAIEAISREQHALARYKAAYQRAATELRTGRSPLTVRALLHEELAHAVIAPAG